VAVRPHPTPLAFAALRRATLPLQGLQGRVKSVPYLISFT